MRAVKGLGTAVLAAALTSGIPAPALEGKEPSYAQCECKPLERDRADFFSTIKNASLCVSTGADNHTPRCAITVYCLSDGTGPGCSNHPGRQNGMVDQVTRGDIPISSFIDFAVVLFEDHQRRDGPRIDLSSTSLRDLLMRSADRLMHCFKIFGSGERLVLGDRRNDQVLCALRPAHNSLVVVTYQAERWFALEFSRLR
jgi:hypothetical protein